MQGIWRKQTGTDYLYLSNKSFYSKTSWQWMSLLVHEHCPHLLLPTEIFVSVLSLHNPNSRLVQQCLFLLINKIIKAWLKCTMLETRFDWRISVITLNKQIYSYSKKRGIPTKKEKEKRITLKESIWRQKCTCNKIFINRPRKPSRPIETNINTLFNQNDMT